MIRHNFCRSDGRLVKLFLFSTLLHKSPLTSIYFATFEKKREVRSPLPTQPNFLVFGKYIYILYLYISIYLNFSMECKFQGSISRLVKMFSTSNFHGSLIQHQSYSRQNFMFLAVLAFQNPKLAKIDR